MSHLNTPIARVGLFEGDISDILCQHFFKSFKGKIVHSSINKLSHIICYINLVVQWRSKLDK